MPCMRRYSCCKGWGQIAARVLREFHRRSSVIQSASGVTWRQGGSLGIGIGA